MADMADDQHGLHNIGAVQHLINQTPANVNAQNLLNQIEQILGGSLLYVDMHQLTAYLANANMDNGNGLVDIMNFLNSDTQDSQTFIEVTNHMIDLHTISDPELNTADYVMFSNEDTGAGVGSPMARQTDYHEEHMGNIPSTNVAYSAPSTSQNPSGRNPHRKP